VDASLKAEIQAAVDEARKAVEAGETEAIQQKSQALAQVAMKLGQAIYQQDQAAASPGAGGAETGAATGSEAGGDEEVVDAEFSEVDEDNKG
jgi:molecular chaperone DnaK